MTRTKTPPIASSTDRTKAYADAVISGKIIAGPHVRNACRRHIADLKTGHLRGLRFNPERAEHAFRYFETVLRLSEGQFEDTPFLLDPSQAFIIGSLFGWQRQHSKHGWIRRFRRAYIEQGKGNGKSPLAAGIGLYGLASDGEAGAQIYAAAAKREQAGILFADAVKMVKASAALKKRLKFSGGELREFNIAHLASGSFFRPVSKDTGKTGSGPRPYFVLADEVHELPDRKILEMLERGFKFRRQPLLFMITNSGSDRNSVAWEEHENAVKTAACNVDAVNDNTFLGDTEDERRFYDDNTFSYVCALDKGDDPLRDPSCWPKANPLFGVTIDDEYLEGVVAQAKSLPSLLNGILRLHFCVWTDAETAWMSREALEPCLADFDPSIHHGKDVAEGLDLSQNRDITAKAVIVETGIVKDGPYAGKPTYDAWIEAWTPGYTIQAREDRDKLPYQVWVAAGHLTAPAGKTINYRDVAQSLVEDSRNYNVLLAAYDRYSFKKFEEEAAELGLMLPWIEHPQGGAKKGKPTEAMKQSAKQLGKDPEGLWMPGSLRMLEELILEQRIRLKLNPVLVSAMMSAVTEPDRWDNRWLAKQKSVNKIDAAVALCMAVGAIMAAKIVVVPRSPWDDPNFSMMAQAA